MARYEGFIRLVYCGLGPYANLWKGVLIVLYNLHIKSLLISDVRRRLVS